ncbi:hypothetical protein ABLG96_04870 [Nakamurella sp. A5-74]|uniref:Uncharacterized protein n=1 Tax=Nakamurella sp. A5-74 TaxID=3158264 RepID=A0AAU8DSN2_9ACTN
MNPSVPACPSCGSTDGFDAGYLPDSQPGGMIVGRWMPGVPEFGLLKGLKWRGRVHLEVRADRCRRCGLLALYAVGPAR